MTLEEIILQLLANPKIAALVAGFGVPIWAIITVIKTVPLAVRLYEVAMIDRPGPERFKAVLEEVERSLPAITKLIPGFKLLLRPLVKWLIERNARTLAPTSTTREAMRGKLNPAS